MNIKRFIIFLAAMAILLVCLKLAVAAEPVKPDPVPTKQELLILIQYYDEHLRHIQTQRSVLDYDEKFTREKRDEIRKQISEIISQQEKDKKPGDSGNAKEEK